MIILPILKMYKIYMHWKYTFIAIMFIRKYKNFEKKYAIIYIIYILFYSIIHISFLLHLIVHILYSCVLACKIEWQFCNTHRLHFVAFVNS